MCAFNNFSPANWLFQRASRSPLSCPALNVATNAFSSSTLMSSSNASCAKSSPRLNPTVDVSSSVDASQSCKCPVIALASRKRYFVKACWILWNVRRLSRPIVLKYAASVVGFPRNPQGFLWYFLTISSTSRVDLIWPTACDEMLAFCGGVTCLCGSGIPSW